MVAQYQHEYLADLDRQDASATLIGTAAAVGLAALARRVRYLFEDIDNDETRWKSRSGATSTPASACARATGCAFATTCTSISMIAMSTEERVPSPEHWLWLEYESRFRQQVTPRARTRRGVLDRGRAWRLSETLRPPGRPGCRGDSRGFSGGRGWFGPCCAGGSMASKLALLARRHLAAGGTPVRFRPGTRGPGLPAGRRRRLTASATSRKAGHVR